MKHIFAIAQDDGSFPSIGMTDRWLRSGLTPRQAIRLAKQTARNRNRPVRLETWLDNDFYKPESTSIVQIVE